VTQLRIFLIGVQFFTRIPITGSFARWVGFKPEWISRATRFFPLIGLLVAACMSVFFLLALHLTVPGVALALTLAFGVLLTGAFHEDGFADFCDGFGGGHTPESIVSIMRDSRVGAYGAIAISVLMLIKFASLWGKPFLSVCIALCFAHVISRAAAVVIMSMLPYVEATIGNKTNAQVKPVAQHLRGPDKLLPLFTLLAVTVLCVHYGLPWRQIAVSLALVFITVLWMYRTLKRRLGGYTGDTLGATQQICEVACLVALAKPY
jgi:adenosylcobinamide-GDP ribazoletransferase